MKPILYSEYLSEGVVPSDYGIGVMADCMSCQVKEQRNSIYELELEYAANGIHADQIIPGTFIKAKPNYTDDPQLFQVYKVGKNINGRFSVNAEHVSYLLSGKVITSGSANNIVTAVESVLQSAAGGFTLRTTKNTSGNFVITEPSSVRSWFGGKEGSLLDVYGTGEWQYDNYTATLKLHRGTDRGVTIRYGKNLTELSQEIDASNIVISVIPYYKPQEEGIPNIVGSEVFIPNPPEFDMGKSVAIDFTEDVVIDSDVSIYDQYNEILTQLADLATNYVNNHSLGNALSNITLDFVQLEGLAERIDLCDTVHVYFEALGIETEMKCVGTTWDVLAERYTEITLGDPKQSIADTISGTNTAVANAQRSADEANANANTAITEAGQKKRVFIDTPVPPYDVGDMWVNGQDIYYCINPKTRTITGTAGSSSNPITFTAPLAEPLVSFTAQLGITTGAELNSLTITHLDENDAVLQTFIVEFSQPVTHRTAANPTLNIIEGVLTYPDDVTIEATPTTIIPIVGVNKIRISSEDDPSLFVFPTVEYLVEGFQLSDWNLASNYVSQSLLEDAIKAATDIITGNRGGYVIMHDSNEDGLPDEILVMDTPDVSTALKIWRWNTGGLGYSSTGYGGPYSPTIDASGRIVADSIATGNLDALKVTIQHLTAAMFEGSKISLGGINNESGVLEIKDETGMVIGEMTKDGLKFYGAGPVGKRPYVLLNNTVGFAGYDANGNAIFWVN
ncbi:MAG: phage tail protein, partial [Clostridiales bacterium]|nr:phage tail protein [Clostridiales bacterium]